MSAIRRWFISATWPLWLPALVVAGVLDLRDHERAYPGGRERGGGMEDHADDPVEGEE